MGGLDILKEMLESGELKEMLPTKVSPLSVTDSCCFSVTLTLMLPSLGNFLVVDLLTPR